MTRAGIAPAILLMGPTASGKTDLAVALTDALPCDIISVDSAMIYRGMDIGTAKPDAATLKRAPHHLIDIRNPDQSYSAAEFRADALRCMAQSVERGRIPLLVGGTMLYFRSLLRGLADLPSADPAVREMLEREAQQLGWASLHRQLGEVDPVAAARIHPNDPQRIQRALEVYRLTGKSLTEWLAAGSGAAFPYRPIVLVVAPVDRSVLHARIERRFHGMLEQGLIAELETLRRCWSLHRDLPAMRSVGYRQVWDYLEGACPRAELAARGIAATRQFAKRQLTWLRGDWGGQWFEATAPYLADEVLKYLKKAAI